MSSGGFICPHCRRYTARGERKCIHCGLYTGPEWFAGLLRALGASENPGTKALFSTILVLFIAEVALSVATQARPSSDVSTDVLIRLGARAANDAFSFRAFSALFLHAGVLHLCFNLIALLSLGPKVESQFGTRRMLAAFAVTGVLANLASDFTHLGETYVALGASGALYGLDGVLLGSERARGVGTGWSHVGRAAISAVILAIVFGFDFTAHATGFVVGLGMGAALQREWRAFQRGTTFVVINSAFVIATVSAVGLAVARPLPTPATIAVQSSASGTQGEGHCPAWIQTKRCQDAGYVYAVGAEHFAGEDGWSISPFHAIWGQLVDDTPGEVRVELRDVEVIRSAKCQGRWRELLRVSAASIRDSATVETCDASVVASLSEFDSSCPEWASKRAWKQGDDWFVVERVASYETNQVQVASLLEGVAHVVVQPTKITVTEEEKKGKSLLEKALMASIEGKYSLGPDQPDVTVGKVNIIQTAMCQGTPLALYSARIEAKKDPPRMAPRND